MKKHLFKFILTISIILFFSISCTSQYNEIYNVSKINVQKFANSISGGILPTTLKILQTEAPTEGYQTEITLDAAKGESECSQILLYSTTNDFQNLKYSVSDLIGENGFSIVPETGIVKYVPVEKPMWVSFHKKGMYPDPIIPNDTTFAIKAGNSQALWYSVTVPQNTPSGLYKGIANIEQDGKTLVSYPVQLKVYNVELPKTSFLSTVFLFRARFYAQKYYGTSWSKEQEDNLPHLTLKYRMSSPVNLKWLESFYTDSNGNLNVDWTEFDKRVLYWKDLGMNTFELQNIEFGTKIPEDKKEQEYWEQVFELTNKHLVEKNWTNEFYIYAFDEPTTKKLKDVQNLCKWIHVHGPDLQIIFTMGFTSSGPAWLENFVDIWVPHINQYDKDFFTSEQLKGNKVWIYTCMQTFMLRHPDNWKIDWYGTSHRALGSWLFKHNADGYLYWGVDTWKNNPWETTETFPLTNGDGSMFYPAPDGKSDYYPSTRLFMTRDGFEDFDLLTMLKQKAKFISNKTEIGKEIQEILSCSNLIPKEDIFETNDYAYIKTHKRILEILEELK